MNFYRTRFLGAPNRFCKVIQQTFLNNTQPGRPARRYAVTLLLALCAVAFVTSAAQASSLTSTPSSVSFGTVSVGNKVTQTLAVKNVTTGSVTVSSASMSNAAFSISSLVMPFSIAAGTTNYFAVGFKPTTSGTVTGTLTLKNSSGTVLLTVSLSGAGAGSTSSTSTPQLTSTPSSVSYGTVAVGNKLTQTLMIKNVTSSSVPVASIVISNPAFSISSLTMPFSIAAGVTNYFAVGFKPTAAGSFTGSLIMKNSAGTVLATVPLSGTGSSPTSSLVSSLSSLSFGSETVGESTTLPVTLTNKGTSNVTISGVSITGSSAYSVTSGISGATLAPGQSAIMSIVFAPKTTGALSATVTVVSNTTSTAPAIAVSGTGISNTSHSVALNWSASTTSGISGYYVYRSSVSGSSYSRINSTPTASLKYTDGNVASGATYYYVVTAVTSAGAESAHSSQVKAVIP